MLETPFYRLTPCLKGTLIAMQKENNLGIPPIVVRENKVLYMSMTATTIAVNLHDGRAVVSKPSRRVQLSSNKSIIMQTHCSGAPQCKVCRRQIVSPWEGRGIDLSHTNANFNVKLHS